MSDERKRRAYLLARLGADVQPGDILPVHAVAVEMNIGRNMAIGRMREAANAGLGTLRRLVYHCDDDVAAASCPADGGPTFPWDCPVCGAEELSEFAVTFDFTLRVADAPPRQPGEPDPACRTCRGDGVVFDPPGALNTFPCPACGGTFWRPSEPGPAKPSARGVVAAIVRDLAGRRGLRQTWEGIDDEIRAEVMGVWVGILERAMRIAPSVPEPAPVPRGEPVAPRLLDWLDNKPEVAALVRARDVYGRAKYGQPLMTDDGRDTAEDLRQELGDALMYAAKAALCGEDVSGLRDVLTELETIIDQPALFATTPEERAAHWAAIRAEVHPIAPPKFILPEHIQFDRFLHR